MFIHEVSNLKYLEFCIETYTNIYTNGNLKILLIVVQSFGGSTVNVSLK